MKSKSSEQAFSFPLAQLAASVAAGVLVGTFTGLPHVYFTLSGILCAFLAAIALLARRKLAAVAFLTLGFLFIGATLAILETRTVRPESIKRLFYAKTIRS